MLSQLSGATSVVAVMEELGYSCTVNVEHCKEIFSMFPSLSEFDVAQIVGMVARTYKGLEDLQGTHDTFCTAFCNNGEQLSGVWSTTWNVDVLVEAISELVRYSNCKISVFVLYVNKAVVFLFSSPPSLMHPPYILAGSRYQLEVSHGKS
jgi:hypothetical protein